MLAPRHVADGQVEAPAASAPDLSQRDGVEHGGAGEFVPLPGGRKDELERQPAQLGVATTSGLAQ